MEDEVRRAAVERAYRDHADDVYRVARAILGDAESARDATHEVFARAYERWDRYDGSRPLRPWLQGIAANLSLDMLRRRRVRLVAARPVDEAAAPAADLHGDPATEVLRRRSIADALAALRPVVRAALVLRHYYGYDYAEIAALLGTSPGNVGSMLTRGHAALRAQLGVADEAAPAVREREAAG